MIMVGLRIGCLERFYSTSILQSWDQPKISSIPSLLDFGKDVSCVSSNIETTY